VMPKHGYTRMFENMLDHPNIEVALQCDYRQIMSEVKWKTLIYSGPVDEYFDFRFGELPYRSLRFHHETMPTNYLQPVAVINHPNEHEYTRVTEFKHLTGQTHSQTSVVYEYPSSTGDPYYPIPTRENAALYASYAELAAATPRVHFVGRLGTYRYYNMDQVVAQALTLCKQLAAAPDFVPAEKARAAAALVPSRAASLTNPQLTNSHSWLFVAASTAMGHRRRITRDDASDSKQDSAVWSYKIRHRLKRGRKKARAAS